MTNEYLNFADISKSVLFSDLFDYLNVPYNKKGEELKTTTGIIVNVQKNLYSNTNDSADKGSVINFLSKFRAIGLRDAAKELKEHFLSQASSSTKRNIPNLELHYCEYLKDYNISAELAKTYEIGFVKQRSIMSGKIAVKVHDRQGIPIGYIGHNEKDHSWLFPKGFKRPLYNTHRLTGNELLVLTTDPFVAIKIVSFGISQVASLLASSMTTEQEKQLHTFKNILLLHNEPLNIVERLCHHCFVKAPIITGSFKDITKENLEQFLVRPYSRIQCSKSQQNVLSMIGRF